MVLEGVLLFEVVHIVSDWDKGDEISFPRSHCLAPNLRSVPVALQVSVPPSFHSCTPTRFLNVKIVSHPTLSTTPAIVVTRCRAVRR